MKTFISSVITFCVIAVSVTIYIVLLHSSVTSLDTQITEIVELAEKGSWTECKNVLDMFDNKWKKSKKWYESFIDHREIDLINEAALKMANYVEFKNSENVAVEGNLLKMLLYHIYDNELPSFENIL